MTKMAENFILLHKRYVKGRDLQEKKNITIILYGDLNIGDGIRFYDTENRRLLLLLENA